MNNFLTIIAIVVPGIATFLNVVVVAKRYYELKKSRSELDKVITEMNIANSRLKEVKYRNNGEISINEKQKQEIIEIIKELDLEVKKCKISS